MRRRVSAPGVIQAEDHAAETAARMEARLERDLRRALERDELAVHYQPIVDGRTGQAVAMEALIRWRHPELDLVPPDIFIPLAEKTGLIYAIGELVLRRACRDAADWPAHVRVAVNLSPSEIRRDNLQERVRQALRESGLSPCRLELEISERALLSLDTAATSKLEVIAALGVRLSLDDFGTGFSNLSYLSLFPVATVKLDKFFAALVLESSKARSIMRMMSRLAGELGIELIVEGVETTDQLHLLASEDISLIQGFLFSRPRPIEDLTPFLTDAIVMSRQAA